MPTTVQATITNITIAIALFAFVSLIRILLGYQPHSGQDNHHGASSQITGAPYGGDYEAQRHWMEITLNLPVSQWYYYDLHYWGLDYPPLTAYHSFLCGWICRYVLDLPEAVELDTSRGYEDPVHKTFMRSTVLVSDILCYGTIVWLYAITCRKEQQLQQTWASWIHPFWAFIYPMIQPALILIDHGHFQYNTVALGFSLWSFYFMTKPPSRSVKNSKWSNMYDCFIGSIIFCCALSFKQMTLYYAPAVFCYLLGRCFEICNSDRAGTLLPRAMYRITLLGIAVIISFITLWWPFVLYGPLGTSYFDRIRHVIHRIIPLQRGLFEGKVSNIWCALSVKPFKIRQRIPLQMQPVAALLLTFILILPCCYRLFQLGRGITRYNGGSVARSRDWLFDRQQLLWGTTNCALAFFLASFQVHEKSLLLALAPCSLLTGTTTAAFDYQGITKTATYHGDPTFVHWFSIVAVWTLWPLLQLDRLQVAYFSAILIFVAMIGLHRELLHTFNLSTSDDVDVSIFCHEFFNRKQNSSWYLNWIHPVSFVTMMLLHLAEFIVVPPMNLPDLFPVLWSIVGCGFCVIAYCITCGHMFLYDSPAVLTSSMAGTSDPVDRKQKRS